MSQRSLLRALPRASLAAVLVAATGVCMARVGHLPQSTPWMAVVWIGVASVLSYFVAHSLIESIKPSLLQNGLWGKVPCAPEIAASSWLTRTASGSVEASVGHQGARGSRARAGMHSHRVDNSVPSVVPQHAPVQRRHDCHYANGADGLHGYAKCHSAPRGHTRACPLTWRR